MLGEDDNLKFVSLQMFCLFKFFKLKYQKTTQIWDNGKSYKLNVSLILNLRNKKKIKLKNIVIE